MKLRRHTYKDWVRQIHNGREESALDLAWKTRVQDEVDEHNQLYAASTFLDCSKCYERVNHKHAQDLLTQAGAPASLINMVLGMYQGERYIKVHGRVIRTGEFQQGIIAVCSWAKDILNTIISNIKKTARPPGSPRGTMLTTSCYMKYPTTSPP